MVTCALQVLGSRGADYLLSLEPTLSLGWLLGNLLESHDVHGLGIIWGYLRTVWSQLSSW